MAQPRLAGPPLYYRTRAWHIADPGWQQILEIEFDFISHSLVGRTSRGEIRELPLEPQTVTGFYHRVINLLSGIGVVVAIHELPNEVPNPVRFSQDRTHRSYDAVAAHSFWRALVQADRVFKLFRTGFLGKARALFISFGAVSTSP